MIIDIPPHVEQVLIAKAESQKITVGELITRWATVEQKMVNPMVARALALPKSTSFDGIDAVELQREWRNEWR